MRSRPGEHLDLVSQENKALTPNVIRVQRSVQLHSTDQKDANVHQPKDYTVKESMGLDKVVKEGRS